MTRSLTKIEGKVKNLQGEMNKIPAFMLIVGENESGKTTILETVKIGLDGKPFGDRAMINEIFRLAPYGTDYVNSRLEFDDGFFLNRGWQTEEDDAGKPSVTNLLTFRGMTESRIRAQEAQLSTIHRPSPFGLNMEWFSELSYEKRRKIILASIMSVGLSDYENFSVRDLLYSQMGGAANMTDKAVIKVLDTERDNILEEMFLVDQVAAMERSLKVEKGDHEKVISNVEVQITASGFVEQELQEIPDTDYAKQIEVLTEEIEVLISNKSKAETVQPLRDRIAKYEDESASFDMTKANADYRKLTDQMQKTEKGLEIIATEINDKIAELNDVKAKALAKIRDQRESDKDHLLEEKDKAWEKINIEKGTTEATRMKLEARKADLEKLANEALVKVEFKSEAIAEQRISRHEIRELLEKLESSGRRKKCVLGEDIPCSTSFKAVSEGYQARIDSHTRNVRALEVEHKKLSRLEEVHLNEISDINATLADVAKKLEGLTKEFTDLDEWFTTEKEKIWADADNEISAAQENCESEVGAVPKEYQDKIQDLEYEYEVLKEKCGRIDQKTADHCNLRKKLKEAQNDLKKLSPLDLQGLEDSITESRAERDRLKELLDDVTNLLTGRQGYLNSKVAHDSLVKQKKGTNRKLKAVNEVLKTLAGIKTEIFSKTVQPYIDTVNDTLKIFDENRTFWLKLENARGHEACDFGFQKDGVEVEWNSASGGAQMFLCLAMNIALMRMDESATTRFLMIDEVNRWGVGNLAAAVKACFKALQELWVDNVMFAGVLRTEDIETVKYFMNEIDADEEDFVIYQVGGVADDPDSDIL